MYALRENILAKSEKTEYSYEPYGNGLARGARTEV